MTGRREGDKKVERRTYGLQSLGLEQRSDNDPATMVGYAALFNSPSQDLGGFVEEIAPGCFKDAIARDDVRALWNHNPDWCLGRNKSGTLRMSEDDRGLRIEIDPPDAQWARDLMVSMVAATWIK